METTTAIQSSKTEKESTSNEISARHIEIPQRRLIVVEPIIILTIISGFPLEIIFSQFFYRRVGSYMGINVDNLTEGNSTDNCDTNINDTAYILRESVQAETSRWILYINLVGFLPSIFSYIIFGSISDKIGRKFLFILPPIGTLIRAGILLAGLHFDLPIWVYFFNCIEKFFGGHELILVASFAYIADTCARENVAFRMTVLDIILLIAGGLANFAVGYWIDYSGYFWPTVYVAGVKLLALLYAIFFIPESLQHSPAINRKKLEKGTLVKAASLFLKDNHTKRRWKLRNFLFSYFIGSFCRSASLLRLFEMNAPLCWNSLLIGSYDAFSRVVKGAASLLAVGCFKRCMHEEWLVIIGRISQMLSMAYLPLVQTTFMMFFTPLLGSFDIVSIPITRAIMSKLVQPDEQGALFASLTVAYKVVSLLGDIGVNNIYSTTILILQGRLVFVIAAATSLMALITVTYYMIRMRAERGQSSSCCCGIQEAEREPLINGDNKLPNKMVS